MTRFRYVPDDYSYEWDEPEEEEEENNDEDDIPSAQDRNPSMRYGR